MIVRYNASVYTPAGWRGVTVTAEVEPTGKMATVLKVLAIDGEKIKPTEEQQLLNDNEAFWCGLGGPYQK